RHTRFSRDWSSDVCSSDLTPNMNAGDKSLKKAEEMFLEALDLCSDYHADAYYYLGVINYTQQEMDVANEWFEKFKNFKTNDPRKIGRASCRERVKKAEDAE